MEAINAQDFFEAYNERMYDETRPHKNFVDPPADSKPHYVGSAKTEEQKERRRKYQREYEKRTRHPCVDCGTDIARQAVRCRACQQKIQRQGVK